MRTERMDIRVYRNADYNETWELRHSDNTAIDLTGVVAELKIRAIAGNSPVVSNGIVSIAEPLTGNMQITIKGENLSSFWGNSEIVRLAYDLRLTYIDGLKFIPVSGEIILTPGVTY